MSMGMAVVVVVATLVVVMIVTVVMMAAMIMRFAGVRMLVPATGIGTTFRIERRFDLDDARAQPLDHGLDHVIAPDAQTPRRDLRRQMAIAEMPGDPNQMLRVPASDFDQRLRRCHDLNQPAIVKHQRIPAPQRGRVFQIEQKLEPTRAGHRHPPPVAIVEIEHDGIGRRLAPAMLASNLGGTDHWGSTMVAA
jgi:hypothetical protein